MRQLLISLALIVTFMINTTASGQVKTQEALGATGALLAYNSYLSVGMIADCYVNEVYTYESSVDLLEEQISSLDMMSEYWQALYDSYEITNVEDQVLIKEMAQLFADLSKQARLFRTYMDNPSDTNASADYEYRRTTNWSTIARLLEIE